MQILSTIRHRTHPRKDDATTPCGLQDAFGRTIDYLRVSLTDMCNLRCVYCMPADMAFRPPAELMQDDELLRFLRAHGVEFEEKYVFD